MKVFWDENIEALRKKNDALYQRVVTYTPKDVGDIIPTRTVPSFRFRHPGKQHTYAYDLDDPIGVLQNCLSILKNENKLNETIYVSIGMGLGYSQLIPFKERQDIFRMIILEPSLDLFCLALKYVDLNSFLTSDKVFILVGEIDWEEFDAIVNARKFETDFILNDYLPLFDWDPELYNGIKNKASAWINRAISAFGAQVKFGEQLFKNRISNLTLLRQSNPVDVLKGSFKDKPAVIISAGPSLDKSMEQIKKAAGKAVLIAADSAVAPLLANGITPDIVTTLDFRDLNSEKLSPDIIQSASFSLVAGIASSNLTSKRLPLKNLFFSFQENDTQKWLLNALNVKHQMPPVNSVALLSLSFAQMIEADPIVLVGYDFALTSTTDDHVKGAVFSHGWHQATSRFIITRGVDGRPVNTLNHLFEFKQNFEQLMENYPRNYINATASGADIKGTVVQDFDYVIERYMVEEMSVDSIIGDHFQTVKQLDLLAFIRKAQKEVSAAGKILNHVQKIIDTNKKLLFFLTAEQKALKNINRFLQLPQRIRTAKQKLQKMRAGLKVFIPIEEIAAEHLLNAGKIQTLEVPENYTAQLNKESRVIELEMKGHQQGLKVFIKSVGELISYLKKEDDILTRIEKNKYGENDLLEMAELYLKAMNGVMARKITEKITMEYPDSGQAMALMGDSFALLLDFDTAFRVWENAENKDPGQIKAIQKARKNLAEYWLQRADREPVIFEKCVKRALRLWSTKEFCLGMKETKWPVCKTIIQKQIDNRQICQAESFLFLWQPIQDSAPDWYYLMAQVLSGKEKLKEALLMIETALEYQPDNPLWMAFSARLLMETDQFDTGVAMLGKAVELDPEQAIHWEELGDTFFDLKDYASAGNAYGRCFDALPGRVDALRKIGDCYLHTQQIEEAKNIYLAVLERESQNEAARINLAKLKL